MGSDYLFARPSFMEGAARMLDLGGTLTEFNQVLTPSQADYYAIRQDWGVVGRGLRRTATSRMARRSGKD